MTDADRQLDVLTDQPIEISLAGKTFKARRATLLDYAKINRLRAEKQQNGDTANLELDVALFALTELMVSDKKTSPEELAAQLPFEAITELNSVLEQLGFKVPQKEGKKAA